MSLVTGALITIAKGVLTSVIGPFVEEARDAALNAAQDTIRDTIAGKMSIEEWAGIVAEGADKVKERAINENNLRFVGGKLKLVMSKNALNAVNVSFQLYFLDELDNWQLADADSDIPDSKFTVDALNELQSKGEITFEVE